MAEQKRRERPTLHDVARLAGVSIASVSRVLNNVAPISDELRAQVESAIRTLGYEAKRGASSFQPTVVAIIGDGHNTYFSEIVSGIEDCAARHGIMVTVVTNQSDPGFPTRLFHWVGRSFAMGLIICSSSAVPEEELLRFRKLNSLPVVAINRPTRVVGIPSIRIDYERAMETAVRHVIAFRHRRVAFLNGPEGAYSSMAKRIGVEKTLERLGFPLRPELHVGQGATIEGGFQAMNLLFDLPKARLPTAVIASSDLMALGAMHAIRSRGLAIPGDMTVVGFDDIEMAAHANPPLTTIAPPKFEMGTQAMQVVLQRGEEAQAGRDEYVVMESPLIVRESSGPCPEEGG